LTSVFVDVIVSEEWGQAMGTLYKVGDKFHAASDETNIGTIIKVGEKYGEYHIKWSKTVNISIVYINQLDFERV